MGQGDHNIDLPDGETFAPPVERVSAFADMLPPRPFHLGRPGGDRAAWDRLRGQEVGRRLLAAARATAAEDPLPLITDDIYLSCLRDRSPAAYNAIALDARARMVLLPVAECLAPTGEHLARIEADITHTLRLSSWTHPNNDEDRHTFDGRNLFNDLASTSTGALLAAADFLLGDRLDADIRAGIRREVSRRVLDPFRTRIESGKDVYWWVTVTHNWNSVCLLNTVTCALALLEGRQDRAWYAAAAEALIGYSEAGFTRSGFYTEGVGYWAYGFGCYVTLAEMLRAATGGAVDWLRKPLVERMSRYGRRMEIQDGVYPSFADCRRDLELPAWLLHWLTNRADMASLETGLPTGDGAAGEAAVGLGLRVPGTMPGESTTEPLDPLFGNPTRSAQTLQLLLFHTRDVADLRPTPAPRGPREWFEDVQFLICRPRPDARLRLASTFKGGDNGANHNHNDLGTFTVLLGGTELLTDPGAEVYTNRTFSPRRYEGDLLNSYGHPVPVVDGQLQPPGKAEYTRGVGVDVAAAVLETSFTDAEDRVVLDLRGAYRVEGLQTLMRAFTHRRDGDGAVEVVDDVAFARLGTFETALLTYAEWQTEADGALRITGDDGGAVEVRVTSDDGDLEFARTVLQESSTPTRLAWRLADVRRATVRIHVTPVP